MSEEQAKKEWSEFVGADGIRRDYLAEARMIRRLERPDHPVDVVLDTDTFNEIDDQYALAYLIKSSDKLRLQAIYAAPFFNNKSVGPEDGMLKSYDEILNVLTLMGREDLKKNVYKGSRSYMPDERTPVESDAARDLVERAMAHTSEDPLYVIAIAAITNVSSALVMKPEIKDRMVVVWLGGNALEWPNNKEFNLYQDVAGARIVFGCGVPLVQLPCMGVVSAFRTTGPELTHHLKGKNKVCDYLVDVTTEEAIACGGNKTWSRPIWDVTAVAWLLDERFMMDRLEHAPLPEYDHRYAQRVDSQLYKYVYYIDRDLLFEDLFAKLAK
jgi:inosine-uridine nucleoside N-ribohydrolase